MTVSRSTLLVRLAGGYSIVVLAVVCPIIFLSPTVPQTTKVVTGMMLTAIVLWVGVCGSLMLRYREPLVEWLRRWPMTEYWRFVLAATALACVEEAITTAMTNLAPAFGGSRGVEGITNSTNYFHVILLHSVVVFVPAFAVWGVLLSRYAFNPAVVFLLYGVTGTLAEALSIRLDSLFAGYWVFVYGLFVWLPAHAFRAPGPRAAPRLRHYLAAVLLPFVAAIPVAFAAITIDRALGLQHVTMHVPAQAR
jgi:hypothetical protein